jgi:hypothetical protein
MKKSEAAFPGKQSPITSQETKNLRLYYLPICPRKILTYFIYNMISHIRIPHEASLFFVSLRLFR